MLTSVAYQKKKKKKRIEKLYSEFALLNISLYWVSFKTQNFKVSVPQFPQKTIADLEISTTKYPFVPSFISNKEL